MDKNEFINRLKILHSIDTWELADCEDYEFSEIAQEEFVHDPVHFLLRSDDARQDAIWKIIQKRHLKT